MATPVSKFPTKANGESAWPSSRKPRAGPISSAIGSAMMVRPLLQIFLATIAFQAP